MAESPELDDLLVRIKNNERHSRWVTVLYTLVPMLLVCVLIYVVMEQVNEARRRVSDAKLEISRAMLELEGARAEELKAQVTAMIKGPVQAYARPGQFGGRLVNAATLGDVRTVWNNFMESDEASIRTQDIDDYLDKLNEIVSPESDLDGDIELTDVERESIKDLVLLLNAGACRSAWEHDSEFLNHETKRKISETLYDRAVDAANAIADAPTHEASEPYRKDFIALYWGELPLIETRDFAIAMFHFRSEMIQWTPESEPNRDKLDELAGLIKTERDKSLEKVD